MAIVKPFKGLRTPNQAFCEELACLPYDVMNSEEAAQMAAGKPKSLLHVTRAEIDCPVGTDIHSETVYHKSVENFNLFQEKGWLVQDEAPKFYIYAQTMDGRTQYGIVGCAACEDYMNGVIKKHELTRPDKEEDRMVLTRYVNANLEPVFFSYRAVPEIDAIVENIVKNQKAEYKAKNPHHNGNEEYNFFMAVHFPDNQLKIIDYNRLVKDLNGLTEEQLLEKLNAQFVVEKMGAEIYHPACLHEFSMYLGGNWYKLTAKPGSYNDNDPIGVLDVTILSKHVLADILDIQDLRTSKRIDFVGGIRGLGELKKRVDSGEMKVAFALYPVSMQQLLNIADTGNIMPPKTTWFEPKLRSGLVIHKI